MELAPPLRCDGGYTAMILMKFKDLLRGKKIYIYISRVTDTKKKTGDFNLANGEESVRKYVFTLRIYLLSYGLETLRHQREINPGLPRHF